MREQWIHAGVDSHSQQQVGLDVRDVTLFSVFLQCVVFALCIEYGARHLCTQNN